MEGVRFLRLSLLVTASSLFSSIFLASMVATPAFADSQSLILHQGSTGAQVQSLQHDLQELGYFPSSVDTTTYFGSITAKAVSDFKTAHHLNASSSVTDQVLSLIERDAKRSAPQPLPIAQQIIAKAKTYLGLPYSWGGTSPSTGFDCSGFTQYVFGQFGISLDRVSQDQATQGNPVASMSDLQTGDLVFFNTSGSYTHVGIYIGNGEFINADDYGIRIDSLYSSYWSTTYEGARNVLS